MSDSPEETLPCSAGITPRIFWLFSVYCLRGARGTRESKSARAHENIDISNNCSAYGLSFGP